MIPNDYGLVLDILAREQVAATEHRKRLIALATIVARAASLAEHRAEARLLAIELTKGT